MGMWLLVTAGLTCMPCLSGLGGEGEYGSRWGEEWGQCWGKARGQAATGRPLLQVRAGGWGVEECAEQNIVNEIPEVPFHT